MPAQPPATPPTDARSAQAPPGALRRAAEPAVTALAYASLALLGAAVGLGGSVFAGWLAYLWAAGAAGQGVAAVTLVAVLGLMFAGCRAAGWGMGTRLGALLPALGWAAAVFSLVLVRAGGDIVLTSSVAAYGYLFGGIAAVGMAVVLTDPGR
ncbi:DUF6113 family protein [Streptomonospora nanhaiensis]|uniref:DUF6113 family protein n=1 Tax=Streptomonospora nanhaiensis TaxID=1323731 RepID=UPI001C383233|nr:DUF6113 family protein [Streptomonospora nanhaiensis]MBV2362779.1 hypothetical protein [Streptomonospora nanhaiensis]MBX9388760.1 hypothetical protein [Streptomonospora nanhaiensis]